MAKKKERISVITLGCSKNTVDSERLMEQLRINNFSVAHDSSEADTVIINTCGFIDAAKEESVNIILEAVKSKQEGKVRRVIAVGCLTERYADELRTSIPEIDGIFGVERYEEIINSVGGTFSYDLLGERLVSTPKHSVYLKISEGCDNPCSFCAIPLMRGSHRSIPIENLIAEAESLAAKGAKELIIIGQDTTDYGKDIYGKRILAELLNRLSEINGIEWIRLLYAYPSHFPDDLIEAMRDNPKICKYLDMPLQHISERVLKSMRRGITGKKTRTLLTRLRKEIPELVLRTTMITGYPAEEKEDFQELYDFVKEFRFERLGVFTFSPEENTVSYILGNPISEKEKEKRKNKILKLQSGISADFNKTLSGKTITVLIDRIEGDYAVGRTFREAPEIDGEALLPVEGRRIKVGSFYHAEVYDFNEYDIFAKIIHPAKAKKKAE